MKRLDIITNVGYIQESLEHSEWKGLNKEQTALEIKKIIDEVVRLVSKNESLHLVSQCPLCGSDDLFQYKLQHIHCQNCNESFNKGCD